MIYLTNKSLLSFFSKATSKGHIAVFDLLADKKIGHLLHDFAIDNSPAASEDRQFSCITTYKDEDDKITAFLGSSNGSINILQKYFRTKEWMHTHNIHSIICNYAVSEDFPVNLA